MSHQEREGEWRLMRLALLAELAFRSRVVTTMVSLGAQFYLYFVLWTALYGSSGEVSGLSKSQAVTYSLLSVLFVRTRWTARGNSRDSISSRIRDGSIVYWFIRRIPPMRYVFWRALGDECYGAFLLILGTLGAHAAGLVMLPQSVSQTCLFLVSFVLGRSVLYYLGVVVELLCFWTTANENAVRIQFFVQDLLSGALVPLAFFPFWFRAGAGFLPFQAGIDAPISIYVGRIAGPEAAQAIVVQCFWCLVLAAGVRILWRGAQGRLEVQGG